MLEVAVEADADGDKYKHEQDKEGTLRTDLIEVFLPPRCHTVQPAATARAAVPEGRDDTSVLRGVDGGTVDAPLAAANDNVVVVEHDARALRDEAAAHAHAVVRRGPVQQPAQALVAQRLLALVERAAHRRAAGREDSLVIHGGQPAQGAEIFRVDGLIEALNQLLVLCRKRGGVRVNASARDAGAGEVPAVDHDRPPQQIRRCDRDVWRRELRLVRLSPANSGRPPVHTQCAKLAAHVTAVAAGRLVPVARVRRYLALLRIPVPARPVAHLHAPLRRRVRLAVRVDVPLVVLCELLRAVDVAQLDLHQYPGHAAARIREGDPA